MDTEGGNKCPVAFGKRVHIYMLFRGQARRYEIFRAQARRYETISGARRRKCSEMNLLILLLFISGARGEALKMLKNKYPDATFVNIWCQGPNMLKMNLLNLIFPISKAMR